MEIVLETLNTRKILWIYHNETWMYKFLCHHAALLLRKLILEST